MKRNNLQIIAIAATIIGLILIFKGWRAHVEFMTSAQAGVESTEATLQPVDTDLDLTEMPTIKSTDDEDPALKVNLHESLQTQSETRALSRNADVQWILSTDRRHVSEWLTANATMADRNRAHAGAKAVINVLSRCLSQDTKCGADTSQWETYYSMGGSTLHQALERALLIEKTLSELGDSRTKEFSRDEFMNAQKIAHNNISVMATDLLLQDTTSSADFAAVMTSSRALQGDAREMYFEMADDFAKRNNWLEEQKGLHNELIQSLETTEDTWTKGKLISNLDHMGLNEEEFRQAVQKSCPQLTIDEATGENLAERRFITLEREADRLGYKVNVRGVCTGTEIHDGN